MAQLESLVDQHQRAMERLATRAEREVAKLWRAHGTLDVSSVEYAQFLGGARRIIAGGRLSAADAAEVYYAAVRDLAGEFSAYEFVNAGGLSASENAYLAKRLTEAGPAAAAKRVIKGMGVAEAIAASTSGVTGTAGQYVHYASRSSVMRTAGRDPATVGGRYMRIAHAGCCAICGIAAARGAVYHTDKRQFHTTCRCEVCPAFKGTKPVGVGAEAAELFESMDSSKFADFEAAWLAKHQPGK